MTRHEWLWLVLKGLGIYFLAQGIIALVAAITVTTTMSRVTDMTGFSGVTGQMLLPTLAFLAIGAYLTFAGEWLLSMAALTMPADEPDEVPSTDEPDADTDAEAQQRRRQLARIRRRRRRRS